jgi:four helix bundle protein
MATFHKFEDLDCWQKGRMLTREIYAVSDQGAFSQDRGLKNQIRKACVSILSNIAEGFERDGTGEFLQFLAMAKGSTGEVRAQLYPALDQKYLDKETFDRLYLMATETSRLICGLMEYLRKSKMKGNKYK